MRGLTAEELVDRAARKPESWRYLLRWFTVAGLVVLIALTEPAHAWLHAHLQFLWGVLVGSLLQVPGWLRDRWRWMKWFSWQ